MPGIVLRRATAAVLGLGLLASIAGCASDAGSSGAGASETASAATAAADRTAIPDAPSANETSGDQASGDGATEAAADTFTYDGRDGVTALDLLLEADPSAQVTGTGEQAFVTAINGRAADDANHEFWALYVNGKQSQVGAGSLETKSGDVIEWKIETY